MSEINWKFNIPEDNEEFELYYNGLNFHNALKQIKEKLRYRLKHENLEKKEEEVTEEIFNELVDVLHENEIENYF